MNTLDKVMPYVLPAIMAAGFIGILYQMSGYSTPHVEGPNYSISQCSSPRYLTPPPRNDVVFMLKRMRAMHNVADHNMRLEDRDKTAKYAIQLHAGYAGHTHIPSNLNTWIDSLRRVHC